MKKNVFRAGKIKNYLPAAQKEASTKSLTSPHSPKLMTRTRAVMKQAPLSEITQKVFHHFHFIFLGLRF